MKVLSPAHRFLLFSLVFLGSLSCSRNKLHKTTMVFSSVGIPGEWACSVTSDLLPKEAVCCQKNDTLHILQGKPENLENKSAYIDFLMAFRHYHFETFFDYVFLDKKVKRLYRDSITIDTMLTYQNNMSVVMPCFGCNVVAQITFRNQKYLVPHLLNSQLLQYFEHYNQTFSPKSNQHLTGFTAKGDNLVSFIQTFDLSNLLITEITWNKRFNATKTVQNLRLNPE
jgi:hypothetical protein